MRGESHLPGGGLLRRMRRDAVVRLGSLLRIGRVLGDGVDQRVDGRVLSLRRGATVTNDASRRSCYAKCACCGQA